jgi:hypothetical protein
VTAVDQADRRYLARLAYHLQTRRLPDDRIDDILAEAQAHVSHSGESLREAFGAPREYARRWTGPARPRRRAAAIAGGAGAWLGTTTLLIGSAGLADDDFTLGPWPAWLLVVGTLVVVGTAAVAPIRRLRDPLGCPQGASRRTLVLTALAVCTIIAAAGIVGALL